MFNIPWYYSAGAVVVIKILLNLANAQYLNHQRNRYISWATKGIEADYIHLLRSKVRVVRLIKAVNIATYGKHITQNIGLDHGISGFLDIYTQYPNTGIDECIMGMYQAFEESIGVYRGQAIDAINPLYWIRLIVYLPTNTLAVIGVDPNSIAVKILQGVYWAASACIGMLLTFSKRNVIEWLIQFLNNLPK